MPLDYSKWDNLELSDDSDIEVHPNVDKRSMIKWKQEAIHRERAERQAKIEYLKSALPKQQAMLTKMKNLQAVLMQSDDGVQNFLKEIASQRKEAGNELDTPIPGGMTLGQVFDSAALQVEAELKQSSPEKVRERLNERLQNTVNSMEKTMTETQTELDKLVKEANKKLTSENMFKETHNRTIMNKSTTPAPAPAPKTKTTQKVVETLNPGVKMKDLSLDAEPAEYDADEEEDEDIDLSPEAEAFSKLKGFEPSYKYISAHPEITAEKISDQILAEAFTAQLKGRDDYAKNCVIQSLTLQYCRQLGKDGVSLFFARMNAANAQARNMFFSDVDSTYNRIKTRCAQIAQEKAEEPGVETIQLQPMSDGSQLTVRIPDPNQADQKDAYQIYKELPENFRTALETGDLNKINKVLEKMKVEDAETVVQVCSEYGFLDVEGQVIDQTQQEQQQQETA
ncbi:hsp90 co-chaperone Cdc37 [Apophysomyces ossiformis]|uniref:Hsp90 chaperone protein kinase-targeting subunit n=1 Tax=Apophysomyces ossiformis TaxID=679940 RepID=A0A8H7BSB9_9FUNG|nr:hsp90 co-chaperone Cdc37 [Apophysomyces ossiformis]